MFERLSCLDKTGHEAEERAAKCLGMYKQRFAAFAYKYYYGRGKLREIFMSAGISQFAYL